LAWTRNRCRRWPAASWRAGADWRGFHIFAGSQALDAQAVIATQAATLDLALRLAHEAQVPLPALNLGGGFGIPYFPGDRRWIWTQWARRWRSGWPSMARRCAARG
jgi:diaminopimelate decarboxylase